MFTLQIEKEDNPKDPTLPGVELRIQEGEVPEDETEYREIASKAIGLLASFPGLKTIIITVK